MLFLIKYIVFSTYFLTIVITIWRYPKYYNTHLKYYPILITYTLLTEITGSIIKNNNDLLVLPISNFYKNYNILIYNIFNIIFFTYFFNLYRNYVKKIATKKKIKIGIVIFLLTSLTNIFTHDIFTEGQIISFVTGGLILIIITLDYLKQIDWHQNKKDPTKNILFWLSWGLLIFYTGYLPIKLSHYFKLIKTMDGYIITRWLHSTLILLMYLCFIYGFVKMRRKLVKE